MFEPLFVIVPLWLWGISRCCCERIGPLILCGGNSGGANNHDNVDSYSTAGTSWSARTPLPSTRRQHAGASVGGLGYAVGGFRDPNIWLSDFDEYDPADDTWSARAALPGLGRGQLAACGTADKLYSFGGLNNIAPATHFDRNDEYDPVSDSWSSKANMPSPAREAHSYATVGDHLYAWGGSPNVHLNYLRDNDQYSPAGDAWASKTDLPTPAREFSNGGGSVDGKGYLLGGRIHTGAGGATDDLIEYDPAGDAWAARTDSSFPRSFLSVASTADGMIHGLCGSDQFTSLFTQTHQRFDPAADAWQVALIVPAPGRVQTAAFATQ